MPTREELEETLSKSRLVTERRVLREERVELELSDLVGDLPPPANPSVDYKLMVSSNPDRSGAVVLDASTQAGDVYIFTSPDDGVNTVVFSVDGGFFHGEGSAPFSLAGDIGDKSLPFDTDSLSAGGHTITAVLTLNDSSEVTIEAAFTAEGAPTAPAPDPPAPARGPRSISKPPGAIDVNPGELISKNNAASSGDTLWIKAGTHNLTSSFAPKGGVSYIGELGAILHGNNQAEHAFRADGVSGVHIENLEIRNFVPPEPTTGSHGTVQMGFGGGSNWTMTHCRVHHNLTSGVYVGRDCKLLHSIIDFNGQSGVRGANLRPLIEDCEIAWNNTDPGIPGWSRFPFLHDAGGSKLFRCRDLILRGNWVHDNWGPGLWADARNYVKYLDNIIENNVAPGIFHEVSFDAEIRGNTLTGNAKATDGQGQQNPWQGGAQIVVANSEPLELPNILVVENTLSGWGGVQLRSGERYNASEDYRFLQRNTLIEDNDIHMTGGLNGYLGSSGTGGTGSQWEASKGNVFRNNRYTGIGAAERFLRGGQFDTFTWSEWQAFGFDVGSTAS